MRALSIQQPWAWLIVNGHKPIENRTWDTNVRGEIAIHAGKKFDADGYHWVRSEFPRISMPAPEAFERGGIVGLATLTDVVQHSADNFFFGPFGFVMSDARVVPFVPLRGALGFFAVDDALLASSIADNGRATLDLKFDLSDGVDLDELPEHPAGWTRRMALHLNFGGGRGCGEYLLYDESGRRVRGVGYAYDTRAGGAEGFYLEAEGARVIYPTWAALREAYAALRAS